MKFKLTVRPLTDSERCKPDTFMSEKEDYEPGLFAFISELKRLNEIREVTREENTIVIETKINVTVEELKKIMSGLFANGFSEFRYESLVELP